jgi:hypothetical protein
MVIRTSGLRGPALLLMGTVVGSGCVSVGVRPPEQLAGQSPMCAIEVNVYETLKARKAGLHTTRTIVSELWRKEKGGKTLIREAREVHWSMADLGPGTYLVRVKRWVDGSGQEKELPSSDRASFSVAAGQQVRVDVVLRHPRRVVTTGVIVAAVIGAAWWAASQVMSDFTLGPLY